MSGHSHWSRIKRAKAANDAKRGQQWSKLARRIIVAAKQGGGKADDNLTLRYAIEDAKAANMPNDTINRAVKKGTGELATQSYEEVVYEGYGPGGVAFLVECLTDNRNRTAAEMRKIFEKTGGQLGSAGCVAWMFQKKGSFLVSGEAGGEDALVELAVETGADDVKADGDDFEITCDVGAFSAVKQALADREIQTLSGELAMVPAGTVTVDADNARKVLNLMETLEDQDDVQKVYANFDIPDEVTAELPKQE
ncbi:MAG: YebC/PmpR family DNA-binding transcriptional regulator [Phycisphaerae bacterium]|nr:YebC/PmpR family DNA-binding transcriptional regulator [Phycisphaerae bacterium]